MPFARCPKCNQSFHLNVSNVEEWYRERWPLTPVGAEVPEECPICWGKRTGVEFPWAERIRPYRREEFAALRDQTPQRGSMCPGCSTIIPKFAELNTEREERIRDLIRHGRMIMAIKELVAATGCPIPWAQLWVSHPYGPELHQRGAEGPACYYCGKALRTPVARQCVECGMDWHDAGRVARLGGPPTPTSSEDGPPETVGDLRVTAWSRIEPGVSPTGRTRHLNVEGPLATADGLVIAKDPESGGWSLFHCDRSWSVTTDTWHASLAEAQAQAAFEFEGIATRWRYRPPPG